MYTGTSWNNDQRIEEHNFSNRGAKSLRGKLPVTLVYKETFDTRAEALKREKEIKGWRREKKEGLIKCARSEFNEEPALMSVAKKRV